MEFKTLFNNENDKFDNINYWANQYMLPTALVMGIIAQESGFNSLAKRYEQSLNNSSYGLTQILYTTAKDMGFTGDENNLFDDNVNLKFGLKYLKKQYDKYNQNLFDTISAYNLGTAKKLNSGKYANQQYVNQVISYYMFYNAKFNELNEIKANRLYNEIMNKNFDDIVSLNYDTINEISLKKKNIVPILLVVVPLLYKLYKSF